MLINLIAYGNNHHCNINDIFIFMINIRSIKKYFIFKVYMLN